MKDYAELEKRLEDEREELRDSSRIHGEPSALDPITAQRISNTMFAAQEAISDLTKRLEESAPNLTWISEEERLPPIAQKVLLLKPRQGGGWWDPCVAMILVRYEEVLPRPICKGERWPVEYYWAHGPGDRSHVLITGNAFWASLDGINLPPGAEHYKDQHSHAIKQADGFEYVSQRNALTSKAPPSELLQQEQSQRVPEASAKAEEPSPMEKEE